MKRRLTYILTALLVMVSCSDDFIDVDPPFESSETFFNSEQDYQDALIGAYDLLATTYMSVMIGDIASNNSKAGGENANDTPGLQEINAMTHGDENQQLRDVWNWMYAGVNRANFIMEFQDKTDFDGKANVIAQTRFLRAYYYFELVKFFGDVPLAVDKRILFGDQFDIPRTPRAEVYAQIEADLIFAAENMPAQQSDIGRATKGSAQALLGKVYLYQDKFAEAAVVLEDVILSGQYNLVADYDTIFENDNENNEESVFEVQYTDEEGASFECLQCSEGNIAVGFNGIRNYSGPLFESGFSFNVPTQNAYDAFELGDNRRDIAILNIDAWAAETGATFSVGHDHTGYFNRKYIARQGDSNIGDQNLTNPNNYRAIRFADVLLMAAEALNRGGISDTRAQEYLNRVRERAFGNSDNNISATGTALTNAIYRERRVELVGEGQHFFDLVRTGRAAGAINGFVPGKHELFPIPRIERDLAGGNWEQNPGYPEF